MKYIYFALLFCGNLHAQKPAASESFRPLEVYHSDDLSIIQIAENAFVHTSFLQTNDFGKVPCNGMIIRDSKEVVVFDTPTNSKAADALIDYINEKLQCKINAIVPTHFHDDCLGGLVSFHEKKIPSYGNFSTIELTIANQVISPQNGFKDSQNLKLGNTFTTVTFFGEGHTKDNVVGYFPKEKILFGGCLIKELEATKGYLGDANVGAWSSTVEKIKQTYPDVRLVIPGHGKTGGRELLDYTIQLFKTP